MKITKEFLLSGPACMKQVQLFSSIFPDGAEVTMGNLALAREAGLDIDWFIAYRLSPQARAAYKQACAPAVAAYEQACAPARPAYEQVRDQARAECKQACDQALAAYEQACDQALAAYEQACAQAVAAYEQARGQALVEVLRTYTVS